MFRRLTACLLALILLAAAPAHAADVADLAIQSQQDERYYDNAFRYNNNHFRFGGCGPASMANGLIAALGVTDEDLAAGIVRDTLYLLTNSSPSKGRIQINRMSYFNFAADELSAADARYPSLNQAIQDFGGDLRYVNTNANAQWLEEQLSEINGRRTLLHANLAGSDRWTNLYGMIEALVNADYPDAVIVLSFLGAGTAGTTAPFRSGTAGHYLSLYLPIDTFGQTGVFYVLDSLPRALEGDEYGSNMPYAVKYDFVGPQKQSTSLDYFNDLFQVERVKPTIVQVVPRGTARGAINAAAQGDVALPVRAILSRLNEVVTFFGSSYIFFVLPEH